ncbi:MAG: CHAT domain-containing protein, partial [Rhodocyclaceae bacterium]|nr:CHAT domain-containing protein [Rhodocyclaceae bacterium]
PALIRQTIPTLVGLVALGLCLLATPARADLYSEVSSFATTGRFDEIERLLEPVAAQRALSNPERHALCYAYSKTKRYDRLLPCLDALEKGLKKGSPHTWLFGLDDATPVVHLMRAVARTDLAQYREALAEARKAVDWLGGDFDGFADIAIEAYAVRSIAATLSGDRDQGRSLARELQNLDIAWGEAQDFATIRSLALARCYAALGDFPQVIKAIREDEGFEWRVWADNLISGASLRGISNWVWIELPRGFLLNRALLETGKLDEAKAGLDQLLAAPAAPANGEIFWMMLYDRGRIAAKQGDTDAAISYFRQAIEAIELQRSSINTEAAKIGFVGDKQAVYAELIEMLLAAGRNNIAFDYMERSKARALVDMLAAKNDFLVSGARSGEARETFSRLKEAMLQRQVQVPVGADATRGSVATLSLEQIKARLAVIAPDLASLISVASLTTSDVEARLNDQEAVLEYYGHGGKLYAALLNEGKVQVTEIASAGLQDAVRAFRRAIEERTDDVEAQARALYDRLIRPVKGIDKTVNLLIVPHGILHYVSFGALHDGDDYWLAKRSMRFLPSASVVGFIDSPKELHAPAKLLAFGNPDLGDPRFDLPSAQREVETISGMVPDSRAFVRAQASETEFKQNAGRYRYLHIASHGEYNADNALQSRLLLAKDGQNDGSLTTDELYSLQLDADMVTLSACETGLGTVLSGDDVVGLTRGFLYAGASNIVASLWQVDDDATTLLMQTFYRRLEAGDSKRHALREAQLVTRRKYPQPFFWAAFFVTGNGR